MKNENVFGCYEILNFVVNDLVVDVDDDVGDDFYELIRGCYYFWLNLLLIIIEYVSVL